MKSVKKFKSFQELKSSEDKKIAEPSSLKQHIVFEKLIAEIRKVKKQ
jgi:hypothetical protein